MDNEGNGETEAREWAWIGNKPYCQISLPLSDHFLDFPCEITVINMFLFIQERRRKIPGIALSSPEIGKGPGGYLEVPSEYTVPIIAFEFSRVSALIPIVKR